jgi:hypothetical protein
MAANAKSCGIVITSVVKIIVQHVWLCLNQGAPYYSKYKLQQKWAVLNLLVKFYTWISMY